MRDLRINGIVPVIPTPFFADDRPDWESLRGLIDFAHAVGACAICLPAYAGEFYKLSESERRDAVTRAAEYATDRIPVIAQVNFMTPRMVVESGAVAAENGATGLCSAVPRLIPLSEKDLFRYFADILDSVELPFIIQDFNPSGSTLSASFVAKLNSAFPHFRYIKLEEPMMAARVREINDASEGRVGVLEGWGGMHMLELIRAGIAGVMPGLGVSDVLGLSFRQAKDNDYDSAYESFKHVCPHIVFSLQSIELLHHAEKRLLQARGLLQNAFVRQARIELAEEDAKHIEFLNDKLLMSLDRLGIARNPLLSKSSEYR
ncbi:MAG: dihydrodipicolinate synthase family protein [Bryobacteraceae bacterium]